eukprot:2035712-Prymnesium_polylepis.1
MSPVRTKTKAREAQRQVKGRAVGMLRVRWRGCAEIWCASGCWQILLCTHSTTSAGRPHVCCWTFATFGLRRRR